MLPFYSFSLLIICIFYANHSNQMFQNLPSLTLPIIPKTFVIDSCDDFIPIILKQNGWKQLSKNSNSWHLKWTWKADNKQIENLQKGQYINHFKGSDEITTKLGMSLLLKRNPIIMDSGKSYDSFFPRSYNLRYVYAYDYSSEKQDFIKDYIHTGILNLLKKIKVCVEVYYKEQYIQANLILKSIKNKSTNQILQKILQEQKLFDTSKSKQKFEIDGELFVRLLFYLEHVLSLEQSYEFSQEQLYELSQYSKEQIPFHSFKGRNKAIPSIQSLALILLYHEKCLKQISSFYQDGFSNIWVIKSNHSSRGRNISIFNNLKSIEGFDNGMKLVQKYIENIWILHEVDDETLKKCPKINKILRKKFDIRYWVFVKSFNPLCIYIYDQAYLRISSQSYRLDSLNTMNVHLTNYSSNWKTKKNNENDQSSYLLLNDFFQYLEGQRIKNTKQIQINIDKAISQILKCVQAKQDIKCFQLFGVDVILDANLNPWVLQCNMSPACSPRGDLKNILKNMNQGLLSIMGFIQKPSNGWKLLVNEKKIQINQNFNIFKQTKTDFNKQLRSNVSVRNLNQISISANKFSWKKYRHLQEIHYYLQKLKYIQSFYRFRFKVKKIEQSNQKQESKLKRKQGQSLKIIEVLAKLSKKAKIKWLKFFSLSVKRAYVVRSSRLRQKRCLYA